MKLYFNKCEICKLGASSGYVVGDTFAHSVKCRRTLISDTEYVALFDESADDYDENQDWAYWTSWEEPTNGTALYNKAGEVMKGKEEWLS